MLRWAVRRSIRVESWRAAVEAAARGRWDGMDLATLAKRNRKRQSERGVRHGFRTSGQGRIYLTVAAARAELRSAERGPLSAPCLRLGHLESEADVPSFRGMRLPHGP